MGNTPSQKKLAPRAIPAPYMRALTRDKYLVLLPKNKTRLIRPAEFILTAHCVEDVSSSQATTHQTGPLPKTIAAVRLREPQET